jgi:AAA domain-containing protein
MPIHTHKTEQTGDPSAPFIPLSALLKCSDQEFVDQYANHERFAAMVIARSIKIKVGELEAFLADLDNGKGLGNWSLNRDSNGSKFPKIKKGSSIIVKPAEVAPWSIEGIVRNACKLVIGAPSKSRKSWLLIYMAVCIALGRRWLDTFQCTKGRVLYVNFELKEYTFEDRLSKVAKTLGVELSDIYDNLDVWHLRGCSADAKETVNEMVKQINGTTAVTCYPPYREFHEAGLGGELESFFQKYEEVVAQYGRDVNNWPTVIFTDRTKYDLVVIDPTYKMLGDRDENKANEMNQLMNHFEDIAKQLGAMVAFVTHFPKGNLEKRDAMDRISGSGVFGRDPDAIITMSELPPKKKTKAKKANENANGLPDVAMQILGLLDKPMKRKDWLAAFVTISKKKPNEIDGKFYSRIDNLLSKYQKTLRAEGDGLEILIAFDQDAKLYSRTEAGDKAAADFLARMAKDDEAEDEDADGIDPEDFDDDLRSKSNKTYVMDFEFRDAAPQESFTVRFGDWKNGDYIHHRTNDKPSDFEQEPESTDGWKHEMPCKIVESEEKAGGLVPAGTYIRAICLKCKAVSEASHIEVKKPVLSAQKRCCVSLAEECTCEIPEGKKKWFVAQDEPMF